MARRTMGQARADAVDEGKKPWAALALVSVVGFAAWFGLMWMLRGMDSVATVGGVVIALMAGGFACMPALIGWRWKDERKGMMVTGALFLLGAVAAVAVAQLT